MISTMISEIPQAILSILEGFLSSKIRDQLTSKIGLLVISLMLLTSSCNLFIYIFMSKKFREVAKNYVCFPCRKIRKMATSRQSSST
ncbi:hypothetical protein PENTCL1PPCAC_15668 [Pristionchus entomophagus]|uniref:G protein-coupled receptor n=1 Tax=Pristionchus entomophagus TaxID=358040 RepID=A0AAV5TGR9_9BILA|nr:hypothetical protein PENTCL1PPCAC_15668 [Pristionchus entomophagus]